MKSQNNKSPQYQMITAAAAKSLQSCPTLCSPIRRQPATLHHLWYSNITELQIKVF